MPKSALLSGLLLAACGAPVWAYQPLITDDTGTQGLGGNQIEFSFNRDREKSAAETNTIRTLPFTFTRGLSETLDVYICVNHSRFSSTVPGNEASGGGNPALGFKWRFYESDASKTILGIKPELRLPVGESREAAGLGTGRLSYGLSLILTQETSFGVVHANLAAGRNRYRDALTAPDPDASTFRTSISPVWDFSGQWKLAVDLGTETETFNSHESRSNFIELGVIYAHNKDLDFACGILRRTDNDTPKATTYSATAGVTWRFK